MEYILRLCRAIITWLGGMITWGLNIEVVKCLCKYKPQNSNTLKKQLVAFDDYDLVWHNLLKKAVQIGGTCK